MWIIADAFTILPVPSVLHSFRYLSSAGLNTILNDSSERKPSVPRSPMMVYTLELHNEIIRPIKSPTVST